MIEFDSFEIWFRQDLKIFHPKINSLRVQANFNFKVHAPLLQHLTMLNSIMIEISIKQEQERHLSNIDIGKIIRLTKRLCFQEKS